MLLVRHVRLVAERHRHAAEGHVGRQLLRPGVERRLERVAVRAAVPEELDHLDLAGRPAPAPAGSAARSACPRPARPAPAPAAPVQAPPAEAPAEQMAENSSTLHVVRFLELDAAVAVRPRVRVSAAKFRPISAAPAPAPTRRRLPSSLSLRRVGIVLALERADAHAVHRAAGLLALGHAWLSSPSIASLARCCSASSARA